MKEGDIVLAIAKALNYSFKAGIIIGLIMGIMISIFSMAIICEIQARF